jgi:hypothetical protein
MEVYMEVLKYFHQLSMDCQTAIETCPIGDFSFKNVGDDYAVYLNENPIRRAHPEMHDGTARISMATHVIVIGKTVKVIDTETQREIKQMKLTRDAINLHFFCNLLVLVFKNSNVEYALSIWRVDNCFNFTHVKDLTIGGYNGYLQLDEQFIAVKTFERGTAGETYNFISMKTFKVERSVTFRAKYLQYDKGYLLILKGKGPVRILDVASGTFLHDIGIKPSKTFHMTIHLSFRVNSNYVVIATHDSKLYIYDLKCLKETDTLPTHLLLTTIDLECKVSAMLLHENRIVCLSNKDTYVVDLKPVDRLRCPESC